MIITCPEEIEGTIEILNGRFCECGLDCEKSCKYSWTKDEESELDKFMEKEYPKILQNRADYNIKKYEMENY